MALAYKLLDEGLVPDFILRRIVRVLSRQRLREIDRGSMEANQESKMKWIEELRGREVIAEAVDKANEQHYELPASFMLAMLGPHGKYSSGLYPTGKETLDEAEVLMLESYCEKAQLKDGLRVLDLGCGWGSLSLFLAQKYPNSHITGLSNSRSQREYILNTARERGLENVEVITADLNYHEFPSNIKFDRIISIGALEHMKNYDALMTKISTWLHDEALLFIDIFCHQKMPYHFEDSDGWMSQHFFTGGTMPSYDMMLYFQSNLTLVRSWFVSGNHYALTFEDWIKRQDANKKDALEALEKDALSKDRDSDYARLTFNRFRVFNVACAEFFALNGGDEWGSGHYLFKPKH
ncbi:S-adenosyl-L-methionine-dependent methyltransferase [Schizopora paradoxa]|uniref:S-adenosyl-L-methionine-dependent methyltransferase n=1 Tax=Schizopora paradoxa TaxID=27342 RepID=A0A0H2SIM2_9AGAM|nr:S-adenosyl-L-methionine-dependent methyltransferase [Schizopora paradoxa]